MATVEAHRNEDGDLIVRRSDGTGFMFGPPPSRNRVDFETGLILTYVHLRPAEEVQ